MVGGQVGYLNALFKPIHPRDVWYSYGYEVPFNKGVPWAEVVCHILCGILALVAMYPKSKDYQEKKGKKMHSPDLLGS